MNKIKEDQLKRIDGLQREQDLSEYKARLLQKYLFEVQGIIDILHLMVTSGISWHDIGRMIKEERKNGNPLANMISKINLEKNIIMLLLDSDEDEEDMYYGTMEQFSNFDPVMKVEVDITLSAQQNVQRFFIVKKKSHAKELKTKDAAESAIKVAEANAARDLEKHRAQTKKMDRIRKVFWFEKFDWFVSSENYLVISGKSA